MVRKQLFYLTNDELTVYAWQSGLLTRVGRYENAAAGWQGFTDYLELAPPLPSYLLVDVIEEDFQRDTVPHVTGRARAALVERRLAQLYRDTPFRHAEAQGRDKEGRKDARYLFNALTNADLPKPWLAALLKMAVPLAGMYSLASLSQLLFERLKLPAGPVLLVSHQSSGLRQSYFHEGYLRFSRLTPLFDHAPERLVEAFSAETAKTRQFLASTRLLARGEQVQVVLLANSANVDAMQVAAIDNADAVYRLLSLDDTLQTLNLGQFDVDGSCETLYLALLARLRLPSHFPLRDLRHFHQLLRTRATLYGMSAAVALASVAWAASDIFTVFDLRSQALAFEQEAQNAQRRFEQVVGKMPATTVPPHSMKAVVDLEQMIGANVPLPPEQMAELGQALDGLPQLKIVSMKWQALDPASVLAPSDPNAPPPAPPLPGELPPEAVLLGVPGRTAQVMLIEGEITPFNKDYRAAIGSVEQLAAILKRNPKLHAEVTRQPIDVRTSVTLESSAGIEDADAKAGFAMKLTWKP